MTNIYRLQQTAVPPYAQHLITEVQKVPPNHTAVQLQQPTVTSTLTWLEHPGTDHTVFVEEESCSLYNNSKVEPGLAWAVFFIWDLDGPGAKSSATFPVKLNSFSAPCCHWFILNHVFCFNSVIWTVSTLHNYLKRSRSSSSASYCISELTIWKEKINGYGIKLSVRYYSDGNDGSTD